MGERMNILKVSQSGKGMGYFIELSIRRMKDAGYKVTILNDTFDMVKA